jgi:predicted transglutaminase-like cysteine proteinase
VNVFQSVAILTVAQGIALVGCSHIASINDEVNAYPYCSDTEGNHGSKIISKTVCGDCEDYAYTKHERLCDEYPQLKTAMLYRIDSPTVSHVALEAAGLVLDNQHKRPYKYKESDWLARVDWACKREG